MKSFVRELSNNSSYNCMLLKETSIFDVTSLCTLILCLLWWQSLQVLLLLGKYYGVDGTILWTLLLSTFFYSSSSSSLSSSYSLIQQTVKLQLFLQYGIDKYEYECKHRQRLRTVADLGGPRGPCPPPRRQKSPFALMNYIVLQLQMT